MAEFAFRKDKKLLIFLKRRYLEEGRKKVLPFRLTLLMFSRDSGNESPEFHFRGFQFSMDRKRLLKMDNFET